MSVNPIAKILISLGVIFLVAGIFWQFGSKLLPLGRLPGDIAIERGNFRFYFPVVTSILVSVLLTLIGYLIQRFKS